MPASMMIACVAFSPKVTGSRIEMPAWGPMPGSSPTSVPTRQPRNAYQALWGSNATEKPSRRLCSVVSKAWFLEAERAGLERRLQEEDEQDEGDAADRDAVEGSRTDAAALDRDEQRVHHQDVGGDEAERLERGDRQRGDQHDHDGVLGIAPCQRGERLALAGPHHERASEQDHQDRQDHRHEARARRGQVAEG